MNDDQAIERMLKMTKSETARQGRLALCVYFQI